jgi:hypothetical protein
VQHAFIIACYGPLAELFLPGMPSRSILKESE